MWHISRVSSAYPILKDRRVRNAAVAATIVVAHLGVFAVIGRSQPTPPVVPPLPPLNVVLFETTPPPPPPPPPPPVTPSPTQGGGAPAAASNIHRSPRPPETPPEVFAPPEPPRQPTTTLSASPTTTAETGTGLGGQGTGTGTGVGDGDGPGSGVGPMIVRGASRREIIDALPPDIRRRGVPIEAQVNCEIGLDQRLSRCRVVSEAPEGRGVGEAAITIAERNFRFNPPRTASGRAVGGQRVTVTVSVGRGRN